MEMCKLLLGYEEENLALQRNRDAIKFATVMSPAVRPSGWNSFSETLVCNMVILCIPKRRIITTLLIDNRANQWGLIITDIEAAWLVISMINRYLESSHFSLRKIACLCSFIRDSTNNEGNANKNEYYLFLSAIKRSDPFLYIISFNNFSLIMDCNFFALKIIFFHIFNILIFLESCIIIKKYMFRDTIYFKIFSTF